jgi:hypothetical protein
MAAQTGKSILVEKIDFYKIAYVFADPSNFSNHQTLKYCPHIPYIPSVFVC